MIDPARSAFILIDMQQGFIDPASSLCIAGAAASIPACARALAAARATGMSIYHVQREYAADGSDVERVRYDVWQRGGRPLSSAWPESLAAPTELAALPGETRLVKPSFSAFFGTDLHQRLTKADITTVVLAGTTTPNCVRSTCYDALTLGYNVTVVEDATSSRTPEVQRANIEDMAFIGAQIISSETLEREGLTSLRDIAGEVRAAVAHEQDTGAANVAQHSSTPEPLDPELLARPAAATPQLASIDTISTGWINKYHLNYRMPDGTPYSYESVSRKKPDAYAREMERLGAGERPVSDAVCMVPVMEDGSVLLIKEFRYPLNSWCIAFPAGLIDAGETLEAAVERELREETGYRLRTCAQPLRALPQSGFSSTGLAEENVQVVIARVEKDGAAQPEPAELIEPFILKPQEIRPFLDANTIPIGTRCQLMLEALAAR